MARQIYVLYGDAVWARETVKHYLALFQAQTPAQGTVELLWLSDQQLPHKKAKGVLGQTVDVIVYEGYEGFFPNAFGQVGGTLRGNGVFFLLLPLPSVSTSSYFMRWVYAVIQRHAIVQTITPDQPLPDILLLPPPIYCSTSDQQKAIQAIQRLARQKTALPLVITAKRGRGKSAALGLAAKAILQLQPDYSIAITAPSCLAAKTVLAHADDQRLVFIAPDVLLKKRPAITLLFVDEAAALPLTVLKKLLSYYPRLVFATTLLGYEGSGQGFSLRFQQVLAQAYPTWQKIHLVQAIRWADHDPLESFIEDVLLLDANQQAENACSKKNVKKHLHLKEQTHYRWQKIAVDRLIQQPALLTQVFGLLLRAHYQTKPDDLQYLLEGDKVSIFALWSETVLTTPVVKDSTNESTHAKSVLVGVLLSEREGGFPTALANAIAAGERRPKGHLLAQSLAFHLGETTAACLVGERILRIAVAAPYRRQGLASLMIQHLLNDLHNSSPHNSSKDHAIAYLGVSFAYSIEISHFWQRNQFIPVRLGLQADASSGVHSLMMLRPLSVQGQQLVKRLTPLFNDLFLYLMPETFAHFTAQALIHVPIRQNQSMTISPNDQQTLHSFVNTHRGYEVCLPAIYRVVAQGFFYSLFMKLPKDTQHLLVSKVLQRKTWDDVVSLLALSGKKQAKQRMKTSIKQLLLFF
ncbi:MAG: GNAT family N-acetyltransferase [bacterium]